ncbi:hypothetical protein SESBI_32788 [Sesbania bispinosa]|nr:hypothetical protein SESBI_32788 [Sesbania bispinosa]
MRHGKLRTELHENEKSISKSREGRIQKPKSTTDGEGRMKKAINRKGKMFLLPRQWRQRQCRCCGDEL